MIKIIPGNVEVGLSIVGSSLCIWPAGLSKAYIQGDSKIELARLLRSLADELVTEPAGHQVPAVTKLPTPLEVIEYFYQSDVLREHATDVEELLSGFIPGYNRQLIADMKRVDQYLLFDNGKPVKGVQSRIAEMLGVQNAGNDRRRVLAVLSELTGKYSTTTAKTPEIAPQAA
jgi:hypothetical protein